MSGTLGADQMLVPRPPPILWSPSLGRVLGGEMVGLFAWCRRRGSIWVPAVLTQTSVSSLDLPVPSLESRVTSELTDGLLVSRGRSYRGQGRVCLLTSVCPGPSTVPGTQWALSKHLPVEGLSE